MARAATAACRMTKVKGSSLSVGVRPPLARKSFTQSSFEPSILIGSPNVFPAILVTIGPILLTRGADFSISLITFPPLPSGFISSFLATALASAPPLDIAIRVAQSPLLLLYSGCFRLKASMSIIYLPRLAKKTC